jgi:murein DD-endopeptidase MepM/ murein hydrolase activator NlpD
MNASVILWQWLLASMGCVVAGLLVHGLLDRAAQIWPALRAQRLVWLAAQAVIVAATVLPLLPARDQLSMVNVALPTIVMPPSPLAPGDSAVAVATMLTASTNNAFDAAVAAHSPVGTAMAETLLALAPPLWAAIYLGGLAWTLRRHLRARRLVRGLLVSARRLSPQELAAHGGISPHQLRTMKQHGFTVLETAAAVSPMLVGAWHPVLLLPAHLRAFEIGQQQLIVAHELQHWRTRDPLWLGVSALVQTLLWFNPAPRWLGARLAWALELACDSQVLAGRAQQQRKQYASALLAQWRLQLVAMPASALAFGGAHAGSVTARIRHLQQTTASTLPVAGAWAVAAALGGVLAAGVLLQPALAVTPNPMTTTPLSVPMLPAAAPLVWQNPLDRMRVAGFFGVMRWVSPQPSKGLDLAAPVGTPVRAAVAGTVTTVGELRENSGRYGTVVMVASGPDGATETLYAHLDTTTVKPGARIAAGQVIGTVGVTGFSTGPHLHFQVRQHGHLTDPATVLTGLDRHATKHALTVRRQQLGY